MRETDPKLRAVLAKLEARRAEERGNREADLDQRMLAIGPEAGQLLNLLARSLKSPRILELGSSFGYSGLWLADGARASDGQVLSLEFKRHKSDHARDMAREAGLSDWIEHRCGDALEILPQLDGPFDMVFVDHWKDLYRPSLDLFAPRLAPGAIVIADNVPADPGPDIRDYVEAIRRLPGAESVQLPVGSGMELTRFRPAA